MADKSLAKALKRKMGLDEDILTGSHLISGDVTLLMNGPRRRIFQHVCNNPCSHLRDISRKLDMSPQTASWHLSKLSEGKLVAKTVLGKKTLFFPNYGKIGEGECEVFSLLRRKDVNKVFLFIMKHQEVTQGSITKSLGIYQQKLSMKLTSLEKAGLIGYEKKGRKKVYSTTNEIQELEKRFLKNFTGFEKWLMDVLTKDGVNPKITEEDEGKITIILDIGSEEKTHITINKNPLMALLSNQVRP